MHLLLVALHLEACARAVPLGPAMLASALAKHHPEVRTTVVDQYLLQSPEACATALLALDPEAVGFSVYVWNREHILAIARLLRVERPGILLLAGGAEVTADPEGMIQEGVFDLVLPGEGENLLVDVVGRHLSGEGAETIQATVQSAPVMDLGTLPSPLLDGTLDPRRYPGMLWELSRGCPFKCDFCFESRGVAGIRRIPMARLEAELAHLEACGVSQVFVLDPTFNADLPQAKAILRLIARVAPDIHFFFEVRSEFIDAELARLFASIRCTLQIGLQSAHDAVLRHLSRRIDPRAFQAKVLHLHRAGATYGLDLIYGLPGDSLQGFLESLDFALSLVPNHLDLFPLSVLPGTRLAETAPGFGLAHLPRAPYTVLASPTFSAADMAEAARLAGACDRLYNDGKAVPWFGLLLEALDLSPSELVRRCADRWDQDPDTSVPDLVAAQVADPAEAAVAHDLVSWFTQVGELTEAAAQAGPEAEPPQRRAVFRRDPEALLGLLDQGITELEDLACVVPEAPAEYRLVLEGGMPVVQRLS